MDYDVAVIGAGPGGLVSALYLRRFMRSTIVASAGPPRAAWIPKTHNLLGYRTGISGEEILLRLNSQLDDLGVARSVGECRVDAIARGFRISCGKKTYTAQRVILATGICDVQPSLKNLVRLRKAGLLRYCPVCDAYEYRNKKILVLAQDAHGLRAASFLSGFSRRVSVLWPRAGKLPARLAKTRTWRGGPLIVGSLVSIDEDDGGLEVRFDDERDRRRTARYDAVYVELGSTINDSAFRHLKKIERDEDGAILVGSHQETGHPGIYAVGDCVSGLSQIAVAAGQAAIAATHIHNQLRQGRGR
ncbi:MAG: NAD(P)/FAD-dependent oxidoreductase [Bdellovibrionota bacterium]